MVAYNERICAESTSEQRKSRAARMLVNLRPHLERLEREAPAADMEHKCAGPSDGLYDSVCPSGNTVRRAKGAIAPVRCAACDRTRQEERERLERIANAAPPPTPMRARSREEPEFETVWDGTRGRRGASLSSWR